MPIVKFDKTVKLSGVKFLAYEAKEVDNDLLDLALKHGAWQVAVVEEPAQEEQVLEEEVIEEEEEKSYSDMTKKELIAVAKEKGIPHSNLNVEELRVALESVEE